MNNRLIGLLWIVLLSSSSTAATLVADNTIRQQSAEKAERIKAIIHQHDAALRTDKTYPAVYTKDYAVTIRNPLTQLPPQSYADLQKKGIDIKAMSHYKARYIAGSLTGSNSIDIINRDPTTILVIGSGTVTHGDIYSLGPIILVGKVYLMGAIYSSDLVWLGSKVQTSGNDPAIGLPFVRSELTKPHHNLGISPYSADEEVRAMIALSKKNKKSSTQNTKTITNPLLKLSAQHKNLLQQKVNLNTLKKYKAIKVESNYESVINDDPQTLLVLGKYFKLSNVYSLGPVISSAHPRNINTLLSASMVWSLTKTHNTASDLRGSPLINTQ